MAGEIFIGYRRSDEPNARLLYTPLQERGVEAWYDARVTAGEDRRTATAKALDAASTFVLLFSQNGLPSDDIAKELTAATKKKKVIIPVRLTNIQLRDPFLYELIFRTWFDAFDDTPARLAELADKLVDLVKGAPTEAAGRPPGLGATPGGE